MKPHRQIIIVDSGRGQHMTGKDGEQFRAAKIGMMKIDNLQLPNVLFVPGLQVTLFSVGQLNDAGFNVNFSSGSSRIYFGDIDIPLTRKENIFVIGDDNVHAFNANPELLHRQNGNLNADLIKRLHPSYKEIPLCRICQLTKMASKGYKSLSTTNRPDNPMEEIGIDTRGPYPLGKSREKYSTNIVDFHSRYIQTIFTKAKKGVDEAVMNILRRDSNQLGRNFKVVRSDEGEMVTSKFSTFCANLGIQHDISIPGESNQNSITERSHRTVASVTRCLLSDAGLSNTLWTYAMEYATFILNRLPRRGNTESPHEKYLGKKDTRRPYIWGSETFVWNRMQENLKTEQTQRSY